DYDCRERDHDQREGEQTVSKGAPPLGLRLLRLLGRDDHRVYGRHAVELVDRVLVELAVALRAEHWVLRGLFERLARRAVAHLEEDDRDVVLAAALVGGADQRFNRRL